MFAGIALTMVRKLVAAIINLETSGSPQNVYKAVHHVMKKQRSFG